MTQRAQVDSTAAGKPALAAVFVAPVNSVTSWKVPHIVVNAPPSNANFALHHVSTAQVDHHADWVVLQ
jgi:hypothetical protein